MSLGRREAMNVKTTHTYEVLKKAGDVHHQSVDYTTIKKWGYDLGGGGV